MPVWTFKTFGRRSSDSAALTRRFDEAYALLDEDRDGSLGGDHGDQRDAKVVALDGLGNGVPGLLAGFLEGERGRRERERERER